MTGNDRIDWIFDENADDSLEARYDQWATTYDTDHDEWGWRGPEIVATSLLRLADPATVAAIVIDAGCGTGKAGVALRNAGWTGTILGLDISQGMLDVAAQSRAYDELRKCSLTDITLPKDCAIAVVSSGVFTHGHVGGEAFSELCRITKPGGLVTITQRLDLSPEFEPHSSALVAAGRWTEIERTAPESFHPERDESAQIAITWRVLN